MKLIKITIFCLAALILQSCSPAATKPSLPYISPSSTLSPAQSAIDNSEYLEDEMKGGQPVRPAGSGGPRGR